MNWLLQTSFLKPIRMLLSGAVKDIFLKKRAIIVYYSDYGKEKIFDLVRNQDGANILLNEAYQLISVFKNVEKTSGDIAEVGVYKGGTAELLCKVKGGRALHLFDTFEGLPPLGKYDQIFINHERDFDAILAEVRERLKDYKNVNLYKGLFPKTAESLKDKKFVFVHLDVDLYQSTKDCLEWFYPRMSKGGAIISHDYLSATEGVKLAFDEFFADKPEPIMELSGSQCLVIKL